MTASVAAVRAWLQDLQERIVLALEEEDGRARFTGEDVERPAGGLSRPRVLEGGSVIERAAVNFSHTRAGELPKAATTRRPELAGRSYEAVSVSLIVHPRNPYAPTSHANFRFFLAPGAATQGATPGEDVWWFGGGFDLTPYYGFEEDAVHWHRTARSACEPHGEKIHGRFKRACDEYFFLGHRQEARGIGGVFFDDWNDGSFERSFALQRDIGESFLPAYRPILARRKGTSYGDRERNFQLYRRGRYVEFNLLQDRGTLFGLQAGGPVESILASMPPLVRWQYDYEPEADSPEGRLMRDFLPPRDWLSEE